MPTRKKSGAAIRITVTIGEPSKILKPCSARSPTTSPNPSAAPRTVIQPARTNPGPSRSRRRRLRGGFVAGMCGAATAVVIGGILGSLRATPSDQVLVLLRVRGPLVPRGLALHHHRGAHRRVAEAAELGARERVSPV